MKKKFIIIGLGQTGMSCVKFLTQREISICVIDSRANPPLKSQCEQDFPNVDLYCGVLPDMSAFKDYDVVLSPGIAQTHPFIAPIIKNADQVIGDIDLFAQYNKLPVIAITGSNGKSTVTTMVGDMAKSCGYHPAVVGNIGRPVLSLFENENTDYDIVIMELSSFQLELTHCLRPKVATVLNISPDHLDRYPNYEAYYQAKHRIFNHCQTAVINKNDALAFPENIPASQQQMFSLHVPASDTHASDNQGHNLAYDFGLITENNQQYLAHGQEKLMLAQDLNLVGSHNIENALAALALGYTAGFEMEPMILALKSYKGLPHRCQVISKHQNITWINDSKGTNVGATISALEGLNNIEASKKDKIDGQIILILGGQGKEQNFSELLPIVKSSCRTVIVMGACAADLFKLFNTLLPVVQVNNLEAAVQLASEVAQSGDTVLFSPACASFDQFKNFEHRGNCFMNAVQALGNHPDHV